MSSTTEMYECFLDDLQNAPMGRLVRAARNREHDPRFPIVRIIHNKAPELLRIRRLDAQMERRARRLEHARRVREMLAEHGEIRVGVRHVDVDCCESVYNRTFETHDEYFEWRRHMLDEPAHRLAIWLADEPAEPRTIDHALRAHENGHPYSVHI